MENGSVEEGLVRSRQNRVLVAVGGEMSRIGYGGSSVAMPQVALRIVLPTSMRMGLYLED